MFVKYNFDIIVSPCTVLTYVDTLRVTELRYFLGTPSLTDGNYFFE